MFQKVKLRLNGVGSLLMHNGQTADPLNKFSKASKEISSKRKKVDADHEELQRISFAGALYMGENGPCIPQHVLESTIIAGAKKSKCGPIAKAGMFVDNDAILQYDGPRDAEELYKDDRFRSVLPVKVGQARVMRCRPEFRDWSLETEIVYDDALVNEAQILSWTTDAGIQCGIGDYRPQHGRFTVEKI